MEVRAGTQTGFDENAKSKRTPQAARLSMAGVFSQRLPVQLIIPACCWSVMM
jgi:hypothetical protein